MFVISTEVEKSRWEAAWNRDVSTSLDMTMSGADILTGGALKRSA